MKKLLILPLLVLSLFASGQKAYWHSLGKRAFVSTDSQMVHGSDGQYYRVPAGSGSGGSSLAESLPLPTTSGTVTLTFDQDKVYRDTTQTGNITLTTSGSGNKIGVTNRLSIIGDGVHSFSFPVNWENGNGNTFDKTQLNDIYIEYKNINRYKYFISKSQIPSGTDVTPPTYTLQTVTGITSSSGTFNVQTNEAASVNWIVTTSSTCPSKSAIVAGTGAVAGNFGSITLAAATTNTASITALSASTSYFLCSYAVDASSNETSVQSAIGFSTLTADVTAPVLSGIATNNSGSKLILTYNEALGSATPANTDFTLNLSKTVTTVVVSGSTVTLTVNSAYSSSDVATVSYTQGTSKIQDIAGNFAASFSNHSVVNNAGTFTISDNYTRTDNSSSLGTATTGQAWSAIVGTWGISSNQAYCSSATTTGSSIINMAVIDAGVSDYTMNIDVTGFATTGVSDQFIVFRYSDANNYYLLDCSYNASATQYGLIMYKKVGGSFTQIGSPLGYTASSGTPLSVRVITSGTSVGVYYVVSGSQTQIVPPFTDGFNQTATQVGIGITSGSTVSNVGARFDNLTVQ